MKLVIGLGNPGERYANTRHNIGFLVVDKIAAQTGVVMRLENQYKAEKGDFGDLEDRNMLAKPQTFMNNSGEAVSLMKNYYKIDSEDLIVIHDDVDLPVGAIRVVLGGSSAGHKGVQSIIDNIGTDQFWRVRVGVGRSDMIATEDYVLQKFTTDMAKIIDETADFVIELLNKKEINNQTLEIS